MGRMACVALALVLGGCSLGRSYRPEAFGPKKKLAIAVYYTPSKIMYFRGEGGGSLSGLVKMATGAKFSDDSARIFAETKPRILKALAGTGKFRLVPEKDVLRTKAYRALPEKDPSYLTITFVPASGYKFCTDVDAMAQLARDLGVDAVMVVRLDFGYHLNGVNAFGLVSAGVIHASVMVSVGAIDRDGRTIWKDWVKGVSDDGIPSIGESVDFDHLYPMLLDATKKGVEDIAHRLVENV